ncbi:unnamed protein product [Arctogadus glacialis]
MFGRSWAKSRLHVDGFDMVLSGVLEEALRPPCPGRGAGAGTALHLGWCSTLHPASASAHTWPPGGWRGDGLEEVEEEEEEERKKGGLAGLHAEPTLNPLGP